ncbi:MAG: ABC transporter permease [Thaumarchaeota archaeon]|nr:ABC transporter permease [Nitrososphaerota archaeon]
MREMLLPLLRKEVKELLLEKSILIGVLIVPLIIFPLMGALTGLGIGTTAQKAMGGITLGVADFDQTNLTKSVLPETLREENIQVVWLKCVQPVECVQAAEKHNLRYVLVIPSGFSENLTSAERSSVKMIYNVKSLSLSEFTVGDKISKALTSAFRSLAERIHGNAINPKFFENPVSQDSIVICFGKVIHAPLSVIGSIFMTVLVGIPMVAVIIASYASSVAATSVALEKESKTLEILLAMPTSRMAILLSKLLGTFLIVLLGTISFLIGFGIYSLMLAGTMSTLAPVAVSSAPTMNLDFLLVEPSPIFPAVMITAILIAMVMTTCLGVLVGILGGDVRSAQQLIGAISFPLLMPPFFILMFTSFQDLPYLVKLALFLDPFTHLFLAIQSGFVGDLFSAVLSIVIMLAYTFLMIILSSWLFMGERLITTKITVRKPRKEKQ